MCENEKKFEDKLPPPVEVENRRGFLLKLGVGLNVVAAACIGVPVVGYVASAVRRGAYSKWVALGPLGKFPEGKTRRAVFKNPFTVPWDGDTAKVPCWVRHIEGTKFQVFAVNCTHLGCPVRWFQDSGLFMCPCHGGVYYEDGSRAAGPPPRGLFEYEYREKDGMLEIRAGYTPTLNRPPEKGSSNTGEKNV